MGLGGRGRDRVVVTAEEDGGGEVGEHDDRPLLRARVRVSARARVGVRVGVRVRVRVKVRVGGNLDAELAHDQGQE